jgi:hypothetical protein
LAAARRAVGCHRTNSPAPRRVQIGEIATISHDGRTLHHQHYTVADYNREHRRLTPSRPLRRPRVITRSGVPLPDGVTSRNRGTRKDTSGSAAHTPRARAVTCRQHARRRMPLSDSPNFPRAHDRLVAQGWVLQRRPQDSPRHAIAHYRHLMTGERGYLFRYAGTYQFQSLRLRARRRRSRVESPESPMSPASNSRPEC